MLLSEAIREGAKLKPQGFGIRNSRDGTTCAVEAARKAVKGNAFNQTFSDLFDLAKQLDCTSLKCPACSLCNALDFVLAHLNDAHRWTRERIADWVETIERQST